jgi:transcriptional repressor NrdR
MVCIYCSSSTSVINSRHQKRSNNVWRRRKCDTCGAIFTSVESADYSVSWRVSKNGKLSAFTRDKLFLSLLRSCEYRKNPITDAAELTNTVLGLLTSQIKPMDGVIERNDLRRMAQVVLNRFDKAASVHYQSFHKG